jgi:hypothetical protein
MKAQSIEYVQKMHCCGGGGDEATVALSLHDGGGGEYLVLNAYEWAFSDADEIDQFAAEMKRLLAAAAK